jgi:hypothetical protein
MIYAFICTRSKEFRDTTKKLSSYLSRAGIHAKFLVNQKSIFSGYAEAFKKFDVQDNDVVILCHDDIEILNDPDVFKNIIVTSCLQRDTGFVGVAGTTHLTQDAVWWNRDIWSQGKHRGHVYHGSDILRADSTYYGKPGRVVCMDGVFLAARGEVLKDIGLDKPSYLEGDWDFYDIHYTVSAHRKKYSNKVVPVQILHNSYGTPREPWDRNRKAFIRNTPLPIVVDL